MVFRLLAKDKENRGNQVFCPKKPLSPVLLILFFFILKGSLYPQSYQIGLPPITNYSKQSYRAETQNWTIVQDKRELMYFGNNAGLLEFDGSTWRCFPMPNKSIVRSVAIGSKGEIYVGGQDELGFFYPDEKGSLSFQSLKDKIPQAYKKFADVWKVFVSENGVYWCTQEVVFLIKGEKITSITPTNRFENFFFINETLYVQDQGEGLKYWTGTSFTDIQGTREISKERISQVFSRKSGQLHIFTSNKGIFLHENGTLSPWSEGINDYLSKNRVYTALSLENNYWAIGTSYNGLLILDATGKPIRTINKNTGLPNNSVLCMYEDSEGNLWMGLENGISHIEIQSPFSFIDDRLGVEGSAYSSVIHQNKLYLATNQGIFFQNWVDPPGPLSPGQFTRLKGAQGASWGLNIIGDQLIASKHEGAFLIENDRVSSLSDIQGAWIFLQLNRNPNYAIEGTYNGIALYKKSGSSWSFVKKLEGFEESARVMTQDPDGNIWVSHPYRGVFRITLNEEIDAIQKVEAFDSEDGFPSNLSINVSRIKDRLFFTTEKGVYMFDKGNNRFVPHPGFNALFGDEVVVNRLIEDEEGNIWFSTENEFGLLKIREGVVEKEVDKLRFNQLSQRLVKGFEHIYAYDENHILLGIDEGFILYNPRKDREMSAQLPVYVRKVGLTNSQDSTIFDGNFVIGDRLSASQGDEHIPEIPFHSSDIRFAFSAAYYEYVNQVSYQYFLEGEEKDWSGWTRKNEKEYTNLEPGDYTFKVKAKNIYGVESEAATYRFKILTPWYKSNGARLTMGLFAAGLLILAFYFQNRRLRSEADEQLRQQTEDHQKKEDNYKEEVQKSEAEIFRLKNEKLEAEMAHKKKELASYAMHLVQKSELLLTLKQQLEKIKEEASPQNQKKVKQVLRTIESDNQLDKEWEKFEFHFDEVHEQFLKQLKEKYPKLTAKDKKLCAYLRMNLTTKEIAPLMGISVRGVEIGRYRLRKKLDLPSDENLNEFMMNLA